ncbi:MAG: ATP-binding cassette domain-containing protein, partial [Deltaproteobacteria bacterium]|nr:ATP-binding cassette domain-containing protein [Deltaproteobacteria bacterium]
MSLVTVIKVSLNFVERQIFNQIGLQINPGDRIGLVGPNGSGKTTLLRIIMGEITPDEGEIKIAGNSRMGYLSQDVQENISGTLLQSILSAIPQRETLENRLKKAERSLERTTDQLEQSTLGKEIADIHQEINRLNLDFPPHEAEKILLGLGFDVSDFQKPVSELSGGWKMRAALARLLYQKPDLLLLDEPTNHLDMPSVRWLETFLQGFKGAMILVSHDREFLNRQIHRLISFETEGMRSY